MVAGAQSGVAASAYWDNVGGTANDWGSLANWSSVGGGGTNPASIPGTTGTDIATFSATSVTTTQTVNLNAARALQGLVFSSSADHSLFGGGTDRTLTLGTSGISQSQSGTGSTTIGSATAGQRVALALSADQTWANSNNTGAITVVNGVASSTAVARTLTLGGTSTAANTVSGVIANNGAGVMSLTKSGAGTWVLSGVNSYTGLTTISAGTLKLGNASALGTTAGSATLSGTGILDLNGQTITGETLTAIAAGASLLNNNTGAAATWTGGITTMANGASIGGSGNLTLSGVVASGGGNKPIVKVGTGTLFLTNNGNTFTRAVTISQGVVNISANNALGAGGSGTNSVTAGAALQMQGGITTNATAGTGALTIDLTLNGTGVNNDGALRNMSGNNTFSHQITLGSTGVRINSDADLLTLPGGITGTNTNLTVGGAGNTTVSGAITTGTGTLTKDGTGTLTLSGATNTYSGTTTVNAGMLSTGSIVVSGSASGLGNATSAVVLGDGTHSGTLSYTGAAATYTRGFTVTAGGGGGALANTTGNLLQMSTGGITVGSGSTMTFNANSTGGITLNSTSVISGSGGNVTINSSGSGVVTFSGANTYTGTTTVTAGTLSVGTIGNGGVAGNLGQASNAAGNLVFDGGTLQYTGASASTNRNFTINTGKTAVIEVTTNNLTLSGGSASSNGALTKTGSGTLTLTGANGHSGVTAVAGGTLALGNANALQNSTLDSGTSGSQTVTFTVSGTNTYNIGGLQGADALAIGGNTISVGANNNNTSYTGAISGTGGALTKVGTGTLTLSNANTYTGVTTISAGTLVINGTLSATDAVSVSGKLSGGGTVGGATTINGSGTLAPGAVGAVGKETFSSTLAFSSGSIFEWNLGSYATTGRGTNYDAVDVTGARTGAGAVFKVVLGGLSFSNSFWDINRQWTNIFNTGASGSNLLSAIFSGGFSGSGVGIDGVVAGEGTFSFSGDSLEWRAVPEWSNALAGCLLGAGLLRRRRSPAVCV